MEQFDKYPHHRLARATLDRAQALWDLGDRKSAMSDFEDVFSIAPDLVAIPYSKAVYKLGMEKQEAGDLQEALVDFQFAVELAPEGDLQREIKDSIQDIEIKMRPVEPEPPEPVLITECPGCGKQVQPEWEFCPFCSTGLIPVVPILITECPNCGKEIQQEWVFCPNCTSSIKSDLMHTNTNSGLTSNQIVDSQDDVSASHKEEKIGDLNRVKKKDNQVTHPQTDLSTKGMYVSKYEIPSRPSSKLEIYLKRGWSHMVVKLDGDTIGSISGLVNMKAGKTFKLSDGNTLTAQVLISKLDYSKKLSILYNDTPLPGSISPEGLAYNNAKGCSFIVVGLNIVTFIFFVLAFSESNFNFSSFLFLLEPIILIILAIFISKKSELALTLFIVLYSLGGLIFALYAYQAGNTVNAIAAIAWRVAALAILIPGLEALKKINLRIKE